MASYLALSHITHNGAEYPTGAALELTQAAAAPLLALGRIAPEPIPTTGGSDVVSIDDSSKPRARRTKPADGSD